MSYKEELKEMISSFRAKFEQLCSSSRNAYIAALPEGAKAPATGVLYGDNTNDDFLQQCIAYKNKASAIISLERKRIKDEYAEAPSTEAMNAVAVISSRTDLTETEVAALMDRYGDNRLAAAAISNAAKNSGLHVYTDVPSLDALLSDLDRVESDLRNMFSLSGMAAPQYHDSILAYYIDMLGNGDAYKMPSSFTIGEIPIVK